MEHKDHIFIDQAYYGEVQRSHGCISSSIEHSGLKAFLTGFTDRPSSLPAGVLMAPYYSANTFEEYYIFTLTLPDVNAQRAGMVFTHALIVRIEDLPFINDLEDFFTHFIVSIPQQKNPLGTLRIPVPSPVGHQKDISFPQYIQQAASKLITGIHPIVFCGSLTSFARLLAILWKGLPPLFRRKMVYTAAFSNINMDTSKTILYFQQDLAHLVRNHDHLSDENETLVKVDSSVENFILSPGSINQLDIFIKALNVQLDEWPILQHCAKAFIDYQRFAVLENDTLKQLVRQIAKVSPSPGDGQRIKANVIEELQMRIADGRDDNLKSLRNLPLSAYELGASTFENRVNTLIERELSREDDFRVDWIAGMVTILRNDSQHNWWHRAIKSAFSIVTNEGTAEGTTNIWKLLCRSVEGLRDLVELLPMHSSYEEVLVKNLPTSVPSRIAEEFARLAEQRKWTILHAHLIVMYLSPKDALKKQVNLERKLSISSLTGTRLIEKNINDVDLLALTIEEGDDFYVAAYAERSVNEPQLLNKLDVGNNTWLRIWSSSLGLTNSLQHGVLELSQKVLTVLSHLADGANIPKIIVNLIADSSFADISGHPQRSVMWKYLTADNKAKFLNATADGLIASITEGTIALTTTEQELSNYIISDNYTSVMLSRYSADMATVLAIYEHFGQLKDSFLAEYIRRYSYALDELQAERLGELIFKRTFQLSARQIFERAKSQHYFRPAFFHCKSLVSFGLWDKVFFANLIGESAAPDAFYGALLEVAIDLYSKGPEDHDIWERAGGDLGKLHHNKTREESWRHAIKLLKNGGGSKGITRKSLIKTMLVDYPKNPKLKALYDHI